MSNERDSRAHLRLLQFLSPVLPVGSYSYSQGLEWAVENSWINNDRSFRCWIEEQIACTLGEQELPLLLRLYQAVETEDVESFKRWSQCSYALRETAELRREEKDRAQAYLRVFQTIDTVSEFWPISSLQQTPLASIALFSVSQGIGRHELLLAYAHNWLENSLVSGVKIIPLGQSIGQQMLFELSDHLLAAIAQALLVTDDAVGISLPAFGMASCGHEVQYSRVYRS